jgi:hypothetical protein
VLLPCYCWSCGCYRSSSLLWLLVFLPCYCCPRDAAALVVAVAVNKVAVAAVLLLLLLWPLQQLFIRCSASTLEAVELSLI